MNLLDSANVGILSVPNSDESSILFTNNRTQNPAHRLYSRVLESHLLQKRT